MPTLTGKGIHTRFHDDIGKVIDFLKKEQIFKEMKANLDEPRYYKQRLIRNGWVKGDLSSFSNAEELAPRSKKTYISQMKSTINKEKKFAEIYGLTYSEITPDFIKNKIYNQPFEKSHPFHGEDTHRLFSTTLKRLYIYLRLI